MKLVLKILPPTVKVPFSIVMLANILAKLLPFAFIFKSSTAVWIAFVRRTHNALKNIFRKREFHFRNENEFQFLQYSHVDLSLSTVATVRSIIANNHLFASVSSFRSAMINHFHVEIN